MPLLILFISLLIFFFSADYFFHIIFIFRFSYHGRFSCHIFCFFAFTLDIIDFLLIFADDFHFAAMIAISMLPFHAILRFDAAAYFALILR